MNPVSQLPNCWRVLARAEGTEPGSRYASGLLRCAADLDEAIRTGGVRDELMLGVAVQKIGRVVASATADRPSQTENASEAIDLLYELWSAGLTHDIRPADWAPYVDLPHVVVDVLGRRRIRAH